jgi:peroxiredoxin
VDSPYAHRAFAEELDLPFPLLSDFNREITGAYHVPSRDLRLLNGVSGRTAFLVGSDRVIRYAWYLAEGRGRPPVDELLEAAKALPGDPPVDRSLGGPAAGL